MYKKLSNIFIMFLGAAFLQASEPYVKKDVKEIERNGKKLVITEQHVLFENGKIRYVTLTEKGKNEILYSKYGDYFFGLEFGRPAGSNGGWDFWNFLNANPAGRSANVLATFAAEKVNIIKLNDCTMAEFIWPLSADGNDGKVFMKVMQFPSHKDWLFINLKIDHSSLVPDLGTIAFAAYPGNSDKPRERELWLATKEKNYCLSKNATSFTPASNGLALYSKYVYENFGNYFIFESDRFNKIDIPVAEARVNVRLSPKVGQNEFKFALGYFMDKSASAELPKFLGETQDCIYEFMSKIDWNLKVDSSGFNTLYEDTAKMIKELENKGEAEKLQIELNKINERFKKAFAANDPDSIANATDDLKKIKEQTSKAGLADFQ